jgi:hypothetical protein
VTIVYLYICRNFGVGFINLVSVVVGALRQELAPLSRFHLKTETIQSPKRRVLNKTQDDGQYPELW